MRFFITSYQKAGTHQIMPAFGATSQIVGRAYVDMAAIKGYGMSGVNAAGIPETCAQLREFKDKAFGHLPYLPEYAEAIQAQPTKVIFNVRDPRDVVIANLYSIRKIYYKIPECPGAKGNGHLNMMSEEGKLVIDEDDPIGKLIEIESYRWPHWLGWLQHDWTMLVKYEDLRRPETATETVSKIASFIRPNKLDVHTIAGNLRPQHSNPTFRAGRIGDWKTEFSAHHKKLAEELLGDTIRKLGYEV